MLTNGQHDELWIAGAEVLPNIEIILRNSNIIAKRAIAVKCLKEVYAIGEMTKEVYIKTLEMFITDCGYTFTNKDKEA